ncbi:MAG TPA: hypothetical protein VGB49_06815 [Caulobacteraceae bacterium]
MPKSPLAILRAIIAFLTAERLSAALVYACGSVLGAHAAQGMTPAQWAAGVFAVAASIAVAVMVRCWPAKAAARA